MESLAQRRRLRRVSLYLFFMGYADPYYLN